MYGAQQKRQSKRLVVLGTWNTRQLGATTGYIEQDLKLGALTDTKLGPSTTLATPNGTRPKWTVLSRGRVALALNERWTQAWQHSKFPYVPTAKGNNVG